MKQEITKSYRLEDKLHKVVTVAKKRLANSPEAMRRFRKIVSDFHIDVNVASDEEDGIFNAIDEMKKFRANSKH